MNGCNLLPVMSHRGGWIGWLEGLNSGLVDDDLILVRWVLIVVRPRRGGVRKGMHHEWGWGLGCRQV